MGKKIREALKLQLDKRLRLESHDAKITSNSGLLVSWYELYLRVTGVTRAMS